jgi:hypothetical protein
MDYEKILEEGRRQICMYYNKKVCQMIVKVCSLSMIDSNQKQDSGR